MLVFPSLLFRRPPSGWQQTEKRRWALEATGLPRCGWRGQSTAVWGAGNRWEVKNSRLLAGATADPVIKTSNTTNKKQKKCVHLFMSRSGSTYSSQARQGKRWPKRAAAIIRPSGHNEAHAVHIAHQGQQRLLWAHAGQTARNDKKKRYLGDAVSFGWSRRWWRRDQQRRTSKSQSRTERRDFPPSPGT